jgi:UDP-N-acetylmuramate dehydrogenase
MDRKTRFREAFLEEVQVPLSENVPLSALSSFGIGGPADLFFEARTESGLERAVSLAAREKYPFYVIGAGSNVLFDDEGYRGLIIRNRLEGVSREEGRLAILSGTHLSAVLKETLEAGLGGLEFLAGIPGTVGGAIYGNAGAFGSCLGDFLETATLLAPGAMKEVVPKDGLGFGYRDSALKRNKAIVLKAVLLSSPGDRKASEARIKDILEHRRTKHPPWGTACAGSYFKNPWPPGADRLPAGRLLELAGARGLAVGDAAVYEKHCNFIINRGNAGSRDVLALAAELKERVLQKFGVRLEEEVIHVRKDDAWL